MRSHAPVGAARRRACVCRVLAAACGLGGLLAAASAPVARAEPLPVRNQNPLLRGLYLPQPAPAAGRDEGWQAGATLQWSNTVNAGRTTDERLLVDAESRDLVLAAERRRGDWRLRAQLPVIWRGPGVLDRFIDGWHDALGLPDGDRPLLPRDGFAIEYARSGRATARAAPGTALGDLALEAGRVLRADAAGELTAWVGAELPTGDRARLAGNDGVDLAAWLAATRALGPRTQLAAQVGIVRPGGGAAIPLERAVGFGTLALGWRWTSSVELLVQLDGHTRPVRDTDLRFLDAALLLTLGGRVPLAGGALELGVTEDLAVDRSPDVAFLVAWRWPARAVTTAR